MVPDAIQRVRDAQDAIGWDGELEDHKLAAHVIQLAEAVSAALVALDQQQHRLPWCSCPKCL